MTSIADRLSAALAGRYRIERELGAGGMATVYLAHDLKHDRHVAIKVLKPELAAVLGAERFVVEIKTTAALSHPHILPLFDSGTADGFLFYVMPYIEGETIREKLNRETQFGVDEAVRIAREVADALDYAHRHGIIHRDIKPENILLHDGRAMVMDFGIALAVSAAAGGRMTETGLSLGTPHYMSPEQATAEKEITPRSDVYSLASVLYEMLTGNPPYTGANAQQIIMKIITEPAESVTKYRKLVPPHVVAAVAQALEKLPADRFENAKAFADALANPAFTAATSGAFTAGGAGVRGVPPRLFAVTAAVALVAIVAAVWGWRRSAPALDVNRFSLALADSQALTPSLIPFRIAVSPEGRQIVTVVGTGSTQRLSLRQLGQLRAMPIAGTVGASNPSFSPDGKRIAFVSTSPRMLRVIPVAGGPVTTLTDSLVDLGGVSWASDGYIYYDAHFEGDGLARIRETGGKPEIASMPDAKTELYHLNPSALPNGRGVLFAIARNGGQPRWDIGLLDIRTGKHAVLLHGIAAAYSASGHIVYVTDEGLLMAVPFDLDRLRVTGEAVPIADGVAVRGNGVVDLAISRSGLLVYAAGGSNSGAAELVWVSRDGKVTQVDSQFVRAFSGRPSVSPDGKAVAVSITEATASSIWLKQLDRGPASKVVASGTGPVWAPDGKAIIFASGSAIFRVPADGSTLPVALFGTAGAATGMDVTRDGKWTYMERSRSIFGRRIDGDTTPVPLVTGGGVKRWPTVSPDGRWLAYVSDETGKFEVFVSPFPDTKVSKRQVSANGGFVPQWSRDGRELFYTDDDANFLAVPVVPGAGLAFGAAMRLFTITQFANRLYDVAPDGRRFLFTRAAGQASSRMDELILVQNVFEELKAKVKPK